MAPIRKAKGYVTYLVALLISGLFSFIRQPLPAWAEEAKSDRAVQVAQAKEKPSGELAWKQPSSEAITRQRPSGQSISKQPSSEAITKQQPTGALLGLERPSAALRAFQNPSAEYTDQAAFEKWFTDQGGDVKTLGGEEYWIAYSEYRIQKLTDRIQQLQDKLDAAGR